MTSPIIDEQLEGYLETISSREFHTHIIDRGEDDRPAEAIVLEARVLGFPLLALCGHRFIPSRDPKNYPVCPKCMELYPFVKDFRS